MEICTILYINRANKEKELEFLLPFPLKAKEWWCAACSPARRNFSRIKNFLFLFYGKQEEIRIFSQQLRTQSVTVTGVVRKSVMELLYLKDERLYQSFWACL